MPNPLVALSGAIALFGALAWARGRRAAVYGIVVLVTTPMWAGASGDLAQALAPWSAIAPFALVRRPRSVAELVTAGLGSAVLLGFAFARKGQVVPTPWIEPLVAPGVALAVGSALRALDDEARPSTLLAAAVFVVGALVVRDLPVSGRGCWIAIVSVLVALLPPREVLVVGAWAVPRGGLVVAGALLSALVLHARALPSALASLAFR